MVGKFFLSIYIILVFFTFTNISYAYIDPSAMTYIIQITSAIAIAIGTTAGIIIYKLKNIFKKNKKQEKKLNLEGTLNNNKNQNK